MFVLYIDLKFCAKVKNLLYIKAPLVDFQTGAFGLGYIGSMHMGYGALVGHTHPTPYITV